MCRYGAVCKSEIRPHDLRHTAASLLVSAGANVKAVQRHLGHATATQTLDRYTHLFPEDLEAVAERLEGVWRSQIATRRVLASIQGSQSSSPEPSKPLSALTILMVARGRIELPTYGFSDRRSPN